jgi:hypothetical protein
MKVDPAPVISAANAEVDAATMPAATTVFMKFIAGLHPLSEAPHAPDRAHDARLGTVDAGFTTAG